MPAASWTGSARGSAVRRHRCRCHWYLRYRGTQLFGRLQQVDSLDRFARGLFADSQAQNPMVQTEARALLVTALVDAGRLPEAVRVHRALQDWLPKAPPQPRLRTLVAVADAAIRSRAGSARVALDSLGAFIRGASTSPAGTEAFLYPAFLRASALAADAGEPAAALTYAQRALTSATADSVALTHSALVGDAFAAEARARALAHDAAGAQRAGSLSLAPLRSGYGADHPHVRDVERWLADSLVLLARAAR